MAASMLRRIRIFVRSLLPVFVLAPAIAMAQSADIVVNHSDSPDPGPAGGIFTYTIRLDNNGPNDALNVNLSDTLPPGSTYVDATTTAGPCAPPASGVVNCSIGSIAFATSQTVKVRVKLATAGVWTNTVSTTSDTPDPNPGNNTNNHESTTAIEASDLKLSATAPATITAGQNFNYTLTAQNLGPDPLPAGGTITVSFTVAAGISITSAPSGSGWSCGIVSGGTGYPLFSGGVISCTRAGPLAVNASASALTVPAVANVNGTVTAAFAVTSTMPDGDLNNNTATASVDVAYGSDVSISFFAPAANAVYAQNSNVTYTLRPRYNGGLPPGSTGDQTITVTDTLAPGLSFVSVNGGTFWTCTPSGQVVSCTHVGTYSGGKFTNMPDITVVATASGLGSLSSSATISIPETDPVTGNNTASLSITSSNEADLRLLKSTSLSPVVAAQPFNFYLDVTNLGPVAVVAGQTITVTETLPAGITLDGAPGGIGWTCGAVVGSAFTCTRPGSLGAGATAPRITIPVVANAGAGNVTNTACAGLSGTGPADNNTSNDCGSSSVLQTAGQADLRVVSKTATPNPVNSGEDLTYVISVVNNGPDPATNVSVTDTLSSLVSAGGFQSAVPSQGNNCSPSGVTNGTTVNLSCNLGTLGAGATANVTVVVRPQIAATGNRTNTATINSPDVGDPNRTNNSASVTSTVNALVDIQASKTATPSPVRAGTPLTYVAAVKNNGPSTAQNVTMTDTLPANAAFISRDAITGNGSCSIVPGAGQTGGTLVCSWPSIPSSTQYTVTYRMRPLVSAVGGNVANSIGVTTATQEFNTTNNHVATSTPVIAPQLDILVNKIDSVDPVLLGQPTVYTITINNAGPSYGTNVKLVDIFPAPAPANPSQATFSYEGALTVDKGGTCVEPATGVTSGTLSCSFPGLSAGETATVTYKMIARTLTVPGAFAGTAYNQATVSVDETETLYTNNKVVHDTTARRFSENADLAISKTTASITTAPGALIDYVITVNNLGPAVSTTAQVLDALPPGTTLVSAPGCTNAGGASNLTCAVGTLAMQASKTFNVQLRLDPVYGGASPLVNTATLDAPGDPNAANNSASASTPVAGPDLHDADLALTKTTTASTVAPGGTIAYTLTVRNNGPQASDGATVSDALPAGVTLVSAPGCTSSGGSLNCAVGPLANGADKSFAITFKLDNVYAGARPLVNSANVTAPGDQDTTNNSASASTPVAGPDLHEADLALAIGTTATTVSPGGAIAYTLTVRNNGPQASDGATLSFMLPPGTTFVSGPGCSPGGLNSVRCAVGPLASGANKLFNIELKLDNAYGGAKPLALSGTVNAPGDPVLPNNDASVSTPVTGPNLYDADLALTKTTTAVTIAPGGTIDYVITVKNLGPQPSSGATVKDALPAGTSFVSGSGCSEAGGIVSCPVGNLAAGSSRDFNLRIKLASPYSGARPIVNSASVEAPGDPESGNNNASASTPVQDESVAASSIPTLSEWAMLLLATLMVALAAFKRQRSRR